ncbi:MAG TPA: twin-arginine translocase TatA/TatE family subunit [Saprospiraceae bacterium]|nr:twin-arginine translocase TatA/TatE family subunit [Saprospiraceae bacterium]
MENSIMLFLPSGAELFIIVFVILLLFGGRKIPELMRGLGKGIREFNSARSTIESEIKEGMREADRKSLEEKQKLEEKKEE